MPLSEPTPARDPPRGLIATLRHLGPGLIIAASIVGSGELIVTTGLGARAGFVLLWLVIIGCAVKVFVQLELGRFAVSSGRTTLEAMSELPGPRLGVSWLLWLWVVMFVSMIFQLAGILGTIGLTLSGQDDPSPATALGIAAGVAVVTALLLAGGRYRLIERLSTVLVFLFTTLTVLAVVVLQWTSYAIDTDDIASGLRFRLPEDFTWAFAAFGITGVGASELIYYPYWCLEKGYARFAGSGGPSAGEEWVERARGWIRVMRVDAIVSLVVYTVATAAFYLLGAAILREKWLEVEASSPEAAAEFNSHLIPLLHTMYSETFGVAGVGVFVAGAFVVLFSTFLVANASNARLLADALPIFRVARYRSDEDRTIAVKVAAVGLVALNLLLFALIEKPVFLVLIGGVTQGVMLPLLGFLAVYVRYRRVDRRLAPGAIGTLLLWLAFLAMVLVGLYQAGQEVLSAGFLKFL